jgi:hypothetical protein
MAVLNRKKSLGVRLGRRAASAHSFCFVGLDMG